VRVISIHEAGLDGFWVHRVPARASKPVVDAASIAVNRRSRRAKTDRIDFEKLLDTLMGWARFTRVTACSIAQPPMASIQPVPG